MVTEYFSVTQGSCNDMWASIHFLRTYYVPGMKNNSKMGKTWSLLGVESRNAKLIPVLSDQDPEVFTECYGTTGMPISPGKGFMGGIFGLDSE